MKYIVVLLLSTLCLSCANVPYQIRDEFSPNGYSDMHIEGDIYRISYETYKRKATKDLLVKMTEYRAAELTLEKNKTYFDIMSVDFSEAIQDYDVPEQILKFTYGGKNSGSADFGHMPTMTEETIIPPHVRQFKVKRTDMVVKILAEKSIIGAKNAQHIIERYDYR